MAPLNLISVSYKLFRVGLLIFTERLDAIVEFEQLFGKQILSFNSTPPATKALNCSPILFRSKPDNLKLVDMAYILTVIGNYSVIGRSNQQYSDPKF